MRTPSPNLSATPDDPRPADRELFYDLLDSERYVEFVPLARARVTAEISQSPADGMDFSRLFGAAGYLDRPFVSTAEIPADLGEDDCRALILQFAPSALLGQCWLQRYAQAANCDTDLTSALFRIYRAGLNPDGRKSAVEPYRVLMRQAGIDLPPMNSHAFCTQDQLSGSAFRLALVRLCLARCAAEFTGELIGFTAADVLGVSGIFSEPLLRRFKDLGFSDEYQAARMRANKMAETSVRDAVNRYLKAGSATEQRQRRIQNGFALYVAADRRFWFAILDRIRQHQSPSDRVLTLFRKKAHYGFGLHRAITIGGTSLDDWLSGGLADGPAFLEALAQSEWFDLLNPTNSAFFTRVTAPDGPMQGVFTPDELNTVRDWLEFRKTAGREGAVPELCAPVPAQPLPSLAAPSTGVCPRLTLREMFFRLVNVDEHPEIRPAARNYIERCLRYTKVAIFLSRNPELQWFRFSHAAFGARIDSIYRRQVDGYRPLHREPRLNRLDWTGVIKQFAPTVLVDGCWLQNINDPGMENCPVSDPLWKIYADEIGNGQPSANHPVIYRKLLESLGIDLPAISDPDFANHKDFIPGAFDIPVYLLAVSQFPRSFLPELIGINLAIELSGLGGSYLKLAESLDYWGIESTIVRVHQAADNMASGHSAIARLVVGRYLDDVLSKNGERAMQVHWRRIWLGFVSIRIVPLRFIAYLTGRYVATKAGFRSESMAAGLDHC
jgi:Iron-containing redox enzyme